MKLSEDAVRAQIIITGASTGLGLAFAAIYARQGKRLLIVSRNASRLAQAELQLRQAHPESHITAISIDLSQTEQVSRFCSELRRCTAAEVVINNAGYTYDSGFLETPQEQHRALMQTQMLATVEITQATLTAVRANRGLIVNVASMAAFLPSPANAIYSACKAFLYSFSQSMNTRYRRDGVTCTTACPGFIITDFHQKLGLDPKRTYRRSGLFKAYSAQWTAQRIIDDANSRKPLSIPGLNFKLLYIVLKLTPNWLLISVLSRIRRPRP